MKQDKSKEGLFKTLREMKGNVKACVYTEPLWGIPYNLYIPFATVYMYALGVKDVQIGLLLSIGMAVQVIAAIGGGIATDKLGRRLCTIIFDILSWSVPCLIWAFAQNFWWFLIATFFNSMWQITNNSWNCLLVEDCEDSLLVNVYTWVHISGLVAVFFAPISTYFVGQFSMVATMRVLYLITFCSMTLKFIILFRYSDETEMGKKRKAETADISVKQMLLDYKLIVKDILQAPHTMFLIAFLVIFNIGGIVTTNFFGLYVTQNLMIADKFLAIFPMVRAVIVLSFMLLLQDKFNHFPIKKVMGVGLALFVIANGFLILVPVKNLALLLIYVVLDAMAYALVNPRRDTMLAWFVDKEQRARVNGVIYVLMIGFTIPFGWLSGYLSSLDRTLPFLLNVVLFITCFIMIIRSKELNNPLDLED